MNPLTLSEQRWIGIALLAALGALWLGLICAHAWQQFRATTRCGVPNCPVCDDEPGFTLDCE
jgi:hypothetical protein